MFGINITVYFAYKIRFMPLHHPTTLSVLSRFEQKL